MHNYTPASGLSIKKDNWMVLNRYRPPLSTVWLLHVLCLRSVAYSLPHSSSGFVESGQSKSIYTLCIFFASNSISFEVSIIFGFFCISVSYTCVRLFWHCETNCWNLWRKPITVDMYMHYKFLIQTKQDNLSGNFVKMSNLFVCDFGFLFF